MTTRVPKKPRRRRREVPDLYSQLEGLLDAVWEAEANWRLDDRIALAVSARRRLPPAVEKTDPG